MRMANICERLAVKPVIMQDVYRNKFFVLLSYSPLACTLTCNSRFHPKLPGYEVAVDTLKYSLSSAQ